MSLDEETLGSTELSGVLSHSESSAVPWLLAAHATSFLRGSPECTVEILRGLDGLAPPMSKCDMFCDAERASESSTPPPNET